MEQVDPHVIVALSGVPGVDNPRTTCPSNWSHEPNNQLSEVFSAGQGALPSCAKARYWTGL